MKKTLIIFLSNLNCKKKKMIAQKNAYAAKNLWDET